MGSNPTGPTKWLTHTIHLSFVTPTARLTLKVAVPPAGTVIVEGAVIVTAPLEASDGSPGPQQLASRINAPVLALQAGADENITADQNEAFEQALSDAGIEHELVVYEGAPHSFFDRKQEEFAGASEDAWNRTLEFIERHSQ